VTTPFLSESKNEILQPCNPMGKAKEGKKLNDATFLASSEGEYSTLSPEDLAFIMSIADVLPTRHFFIIADGKTNEYT
jgi:hypothetical protein